MDSMCTDHFKVCLITIRQALKISQRENGEAKKEVKGSSKIRHQRHKVQKGTKDTMSK